jgi:glycosyltransferase involved in cell wall biosynthesis
LDNFNLIKSDAINICLDARLEDGLMGGVQQFIIGLAYGLAKLTDGNENYLFLTNPGSEQWLQEHLKGPCKLLYSREPVQIRHKIEQFAKYMPLGTALLNKLLNMMGNPLPKLPISNGAVEAMGVSVMHFTHQSAFQTKIPSIYHPWDLQHLHFPEFFTVQQRASRDYRYREFCHQAKIVPVGSEWMRKEIINHFNLDQTRVKVIPVGPPVDAYPFPSGGQIENVRRDLSLSEPFLFYPAQTWPHKNHLALIKALSILQKKHDFRPTLICSGKMNDHFPTIKKEVNRLKLTPQVKFLGFVSPLEIQCLYRLCRLMVFPSKYEGWGLPVTEALRLSVPMACSRLSVLKEQAGNASLYFDPDNPKEMADIVYRLWNDAELREKLSREGQNIAARFSWEKTARIFRACYRTLSNRILTQEDQRLVQEVSS